MPYLFTSERLGFRNWQTEDLDKMAAINADPEVMEYFPSTANLEETASFIARMQTQFDNKRYCYFAVDELASGNFIGFIGLNEQSFEADFTPCVDIGWRLDKRFWNKGLATEGAKRCLAYAFNDLKLDSIKSMAPLVNHKSEQVMIKIGMTKIGEFIHPRLLDDRRLRDCVLYDIKHPETGN